MALPYLMMLQHGRPDTVQHHKLFGLGSGSWQGQPGFILQRSKHTVHEEQLPSPRKARFSLDQRCQGTRDRPRPGSPRALGASPGTAAEAWARPPGTGAVGRGGHPRTPRDRPSAYEPCRPPASLGARHRDRAPSAAFQMVASAGPQGAAPPPPFPAATLSPATVCRRPPARAPRVGGSRPALPYTGNGYGGAPWPRPQLQLRPRRRGGGSPALSCRLPSLRLHHSARSPLCRM